MHSFGLELSVEELRDMMTYCDGNGSGEAHGRVVFFFFFGRSKDKGEHLSLKEVNDIQRCLFLGGCMAKF